MPDAPARPTEPPDDGVPVIGVGASAGGLEAFLQLLEALPTDGGPAYVFLVHLAAGHTSSMPEILARATRMPVREATDGTVVERGTCYTNPPDRYVTLEGGVLRTQKRPARESPLASVDVFLRSLAEARGERAVAVVLSGAAADGAAGAAAVDAAGGLVLVQDPDTAEHRSMPEAVLHSGTAHVLAGPEELARHLAKLNDGEQGIAALLPGGKHLPIPDGELGRIFELLRGADGVDFSHYKRPTLRRRLQRRMLMRRVERLSDYVAYLEEHPDEVVKLAADLLIHVTRFFRDAEAFDFLAAEVLPALRARLEKDEVFRIWVAGCSTGEEVYSVGILLMEALGDGHRTTPIQIFGTDVSERAVDAARAGLYPRGIEGEVAPERLEKWFGREGDGYRVSPALRDVCVFARQDLTRDPPFSRLDLVLCRNVLIYLGPPLQNRLLAVFHYALKPDGFLMLGAAESVGQRSDLFGVADKRHRVFRKKPRALRPELDFPVSGSSLTAGLPGRPRVNRGGTDVRAVAEATLLKRYAPGGVVTDSDLNIVQFRGKTGRYLEAAPGKPSLNLLKMAREGLLHALRGAVREVREHGRPARREDLRVRMDGHVLPVAVEVTPLPGDDGHLLVVFEEGKPEPPRSAAPPRPPAPAGDVPAGGDAGPDGDGDTVDQLHRELSASREYLQSIINDLEAANEELQSANEEILSSNEELQSTNEELDTAKEELQSTNEELNTVNDELHERNAELSRLNSDLANVLSNVPVAIAMVGPDLTVRRFTPLAAKLLNLIPGDAGRSIEQIKPDVDCPDLGGLIRGVIDTLDSVERDVRDADGRVHQLRIRPYRNSESRIDGAVLSLFDVDALRRHEAELKAARDLADAVLETTAQPLALLNGDLRVRRANHAFRTLFHLDADGLGELPVHRLGEPDDADALRRRLAAVLDDGAAVERFSLRFAAVDGRGRTPCARTLRLNARRLDGDGDRDPLILLAAQESGAEEDADSADD